MQSRHRSIVMALTGTVAFLGAPLAARALAPGVTGPIPSGNLSVYLIHGADSAPPMRTLDRALAAGTARVTHADGEYTVHNASDTALLVPFGTLLKGGIQDQVVAAGTVVPPHGTGTLSVFCVDPFRTAKRGFEPSDRLTTDGLRMPSRAGRLSLLEGAHDRSSGETGVRQSGVWWSVDALQVRLAAALRHVPVAPGTGKWTFDRDVGAMVQLADREGTWKDGLPVALGDRALVGVERTLVRGFPSATVADVVGAAFAVNGRWVGAEVEGSHALFTQAWPSLLRSYAIEAVSRSGEPAVVPPSSADVALLVASDRTVGVVTQETKAGELVVHRTVVPEPNLDEARSPEDLMVAVLAKGSVNGRPLEDLVDIPTIKRHAAINGKPVRWSVETLPDGWNPYPGNSVGRGMSEEGVQPLPATLGSLVADASGPLAARRREAVREAIAAGPDKPSERPVDAPSGHRIPEMPAGWHDHVSGDPVRLLAWVAVLLLAMPAGLSFLSAQRRGRTSPATGIASLLAEATGRSLARAMAASSSWALRSAQASLATVTAIRIALGRSVSRHDIATAALR